MMKIGRFGLFLAVNALAIACVFNPWPPNWQGPGITVLVVEAVALPLIGLPVVIYQMTRKKKTFRQSLAGAVDTVMDFLASIV